MSSSFSINKDLLVIKTHFFLLCAAHAGTLPLISVYSMQLGISAEDIGYILAIVSFLTAVSRPLVGAAVDHFQNLRFIVTFFILVDSAAVLGLNFIPRSLPKTIQLNCSTIEQNSVIDFSNFVTPGTLCEVCEFRRTCCEGSFRQNGSRLNSNIFNCTHIFTDSCYANNTAHDLKILDYRALDCNESHNTTKCINTCQQGVTVQTNRYNILAQLLLVSLATAMIYVANSAMTSLSNTACFNALGPKPYLYGKQRLWGTVGFGLSGLLAGYLNQLFTISAFYNFSPGFYMMIGIFTLDVLVIRKLKLNDCKISKNICKDVGKLFKKPRIVFFIMQTFWIGVFIGLGRSHLFWYLRRVLNASQVVLGLVTLSQCFLGELPFFFLSGWIMQKIGYVNVFILSLVAHFVKFVAYSFLENVWWSPIIEITQGLCFSTFTSALGAYSKAIAPEGTEATVQGLANGIFEGLGVAVGSILGGCGFRAVGGRITLLWTGIASFILALLSWSVNAALNWSNVE